MAEKLTFKISSGLKSIIGKELITDDLIAVFELVKNSYDAGAKNVRIVFENIKNAHGENKAKINIFDDGRGMSRNDIVEKWLFVGYSDKKYSEKELSKKSKLKNKRIFAGAKGIGRFSCDKLGSKLALYSKTHNERLVNFLGINWKDFDIDQKNEFRFVHANYDRIDIPTFMLESKIKDFSQGTLLEVSNLNERWDYDKLIRLKRHLQRLINPDPDAKSDFTIYIHAPEFVGEDSDIAPDKEFNRVNGLVKNVLFEKLNIKTSQITCSIDESGQILKTSLVDKGVFIFSIDEANPFTHLKNIKIAVFYLDKEAKKSFTKIMGIPLVQYGSIFLYKNGFRIHPYGDLKDDWLGLDRRKAQGYKRFFSTRELLGRVEILGYQPDFVETSSRISGIVKSSAFIELTELVRDKVVRRLERYVIDALNWEEIPEGTEPLDEIKIGIVSYIEKLTGRAAHSSIDFNPDFIKIIKKKNIDKLPELIKNMETHESNIKSPKLKKQINIELKALRYASLSIKKEIVEKEKEIIFLSDSNPATLEFKGAAHTIGIYANAINLAVTESMHLVGKQSASNANLIEQLEKIKFFVDKITALTKLVMRANFDLESMKIKSDLVDFIAQYITNVSKVYDKDIKISVKTSGSSLDTSFRPIEVSIILDNFISNSRKASSKRILFEFKQQKHLLTMRVYDDGIGVKKAVDLFKVGFSTTGGSGMGLYHISKILSSTRGSVKYLGNNIEKGYPGACFEVSFNG